MSVRFRFQAWGELWQRYRDVFVHYWRQRRELTPPSLTEDEAQFLPAALAVQSAPVAPHGRLVARLMMLLLAILLLWAVFGKTDIVVNGRGKIVPGGYTKTISALETSAVKAVHVRDGQHVKKAELLIELDPRISESEAQKADAERQLALLQIERCKILLHALETNRTPSLAPVRNVDEAFLLREQKHLQDQWQDFKAKRDRLFAQIQRYERQLPLLSQQVRDYQELAESRDVSQHASLEKQQALLELQGQLTEAHMQWKALLAETRKMAQDEMSQATKAWQNSSYEEKKANLHTEQFQLRSPVDGTVQQLNVHTLGGVVTAAQPLMVIVPEQAEIEFDARIENRDIGFIHEGQKVKLKIDTFEYTKYGTLDATVLHVSKDALDTNAAANGNSSKMNPSPENEAHGGGTSESVYTVKLSLKRPTLHVDGEEVRLKPGMTGNIEILTGERRIIEYLLTPLLTHTHESLQER
ncbi:HlyD family type I secretion periplasmic adaptor subunit [Ralstonia chuxiongensis]|uniref:HlyD family type I secretion periplasmic adaptor subunit n=1 Tax=Ralstonia chuxiongensis TaxID=2957504 RepID=UPI0028F53F3C|nr:HlyD family type I secretion periplasmic adaptor subunit [Ralstonia chuxiongensis]CAJ0780390.1 Hemolysin secretion protein D, chromosomal [Ralstonia chuxiongensis]